MSRYKGNRLLTNVHIVDAGVKGKAIGKVNGNGQVVLVDDAVPGDIVDVLVMRKKKKMLEARVKNFTSLSELRTQPFCKHFDMCGGCSWQNIAYSNQLLYKHKQVKDALERIGKLDLPQIEPVLPCPVDKEFRNRLDFAFSDRRWLSQEEVQSEGDIAQTEGLGFHIPGRFDRVLDVEHCYLQPEPQNRIRLAVKKYALENGLSFHSLTKKTGLLRGLIIRTSTTGELMVIVVTGKDEPEKTNLFFEFLLKEFPQITSLYHVVNTKMNDTIWDLEHKLIHGNPYITEELCGLKFRGGPKSFFQTNSIQTERLYDLAIEFANLQPNETVYDLYTGVGTLALIAAKKVHKVIGVEEVAEAIEYAKANAELNEIKSAKFFAGTVESVLSEHFMNEHGRPDVIITDPPRAGMHPDVTAALAASGASRIVYVSCNPATQARDLEMLKHAYTVERVKPVDMFPHTYHVENVVLLKKRD